MTMVNRAAYKTGTCFNPDKRRFSTAEEAQKAADEMSRKRNKNIDIYECGRHWHLTSSLHKKAS